MKKTFLNRILLLVIIPLFWGSTFLGTKICLRDLSPLYLGAIRYTLSSVIFLVVLFSKVKINESIIEFRKHWKLFFLVGLVGTFFAAFFQNIGLRLTTASVSSLLGTLEPVLVAVLSVIFLKEKLSKVTIIGLVTAFFGGFILITNGNIYAIINLDGAILGNLFILISICSYAVYTILTKILVGRSDPLYAVTFSTIIGSLLLFIAAFIFEDIQILFQVSLQTWLAIVYLAIFPTCLSLFLFNKLLAEVDATKTSIILFLLPLYGMFLSVLILNESLTKSMVFGTILTLFGVYLIEYGPIKFRLKGLKS